MIDVTGLWSVLAMGCNLFQRTRSLFKMATCKNNQEKIFHWKAFLPHKQFGLSSSGGQLKMVVLQFLGLGRRFPSLVRLECWAPQADGRSLLCRVGGVLTHVVFLTCFFRQAMQTLQWQINIQVLGVRVRWWYKAHKVPKLGGGTRVYQVRKIF